MSEGGSVSPEYPVRHQPGTDHRDLGGSPQVREGERGAVSEPLYTELVDAEPTPSESREVEDVEAGEKGESTPRYNLRPRPGRSV